MIMNTVVLVANSDYEAMIACPHTLCKLCSPWCGSGGHCKVVVVVEHQDVHLNLNRSLVWCIYDMTRMDYSSFHVLS